MAKISLDKIYKAQLKTKIIGVIVFLLIIFFSFEFIISRNPGRARAEVLISSGSANTISNNLLNGVTSIPTTDDVRITGAGVKVIMSGSNRFNKFTVENNAVVEHAAILAADLAGFAEALTEEGLAKRVDITVTTDLILQSGGNINVSGKGFPGIFGVSGAGPGRSRYLEDSGGAGYGGIGGVGTTGDGANHYDGSEPWYSPDSRGPIYGDSPITQPLHGSSAGSSNDCGSPPDPTPNVIGGAGGGLVILNIGRDLLVTGTSTINADGGPGGDCWDGGSGGGSGGTIKINLINKTSLNINADVSYVSTKGHEGAPGTFYYPGLSIGTTVNVFARGGIAGTGSAGRGGGGRVAIINTNVIPATPKITKTLVPISRKKNATTTIICGQYGQPADCFNPYALQAGDVIKVTLEVTDVTSAFTLEDPWLKTSDGAHKCGSPGNYVGSATPFLDGEKIVWAMPTSGAVSYQCTVN